MVEMLAFSMALYTPVTKDSAKVVGEFNAIENANISTIIAYQKEMGWRGGSGSTGNNNDTTPDTTGKSNVTIFPSDTKLVTRADLEGKTQREVTLMLNEIYARHGYIFKTDYIREYFESQSWYKPVTSSTSVVYGSFNKTEKDNSDFIDAYMREKGWR